MKEEPMQLNQKQWPVWAIAIGMLLFATFFRVFRLSLGVEFLPNFSPLMAAAFCAGMFLPIGAALIVPAAALLASDVIMNATYGVGLVDGGIWVRLLLYLGAAGLGVLLRAKRFSFLPVAGGVLGSAFAFYFVTNTLSWAGNPGYSQSIGGWVQALTVGLPGLPPTWTFFRNSLISSVIFTAIFYLAILPAARPARREVTATAG